MVRGGRRQLERNVYDLALERIRWAYDQYDHITVSFSGGKDSTIVLEMALIVAEELDRLPLHVQFFDDETLPIEIEDYVRRRYNDPRIDMDWYCLPFKRPNGCSAEFPVWYSWDPDIPELWVRDMPPEAISELDGFPTQPAEARLNGIQAIGLMFPAEKYGMVGQLMGIRADESLARLRNVSSFVDRDGSEPVPHWVKKHSGAGHSTAVYDLPGGIHHRNIWKVYPVYDWRIDDIWTAITRYGWDYCEAYDRMNMHGVPPQNQRIGPPFIPEAVLFLDEYATCFDKTTWDRMHSRVPGAATALRYAGTELYDQGKNTEMILPPHMTWEAVIAQEIRRQPASVRKANIARAQSEIRRHYSRTNDPILENSPHPRTGLTWKQVYKIVRRVDPLYRVETLKRAADADPDEAKRHHLTIDPKRVERQWNAYNAERAALTASGRLDGHKILSKVEADKRKATPA